MISDYQIALDSNTGLPLPVPLTVTRFAGSSLLVSDAVIGARAPLRSRPLTAPAAQRRTT
jgi:hypothetical protein